MSSEKPRNRRRSSIAIILISVAACLTAPDLDHLLSPTVARAQLAAQPVDSVPRPSVESTESVGTPLASPTAAGQGIGGEQDSSIPSENSAPEEVRSCRITNVFYDTDVREVLQAMAAQCFVNLIADETVTGVLTVDLQDVPLEDAMRRVLGPFGLTFRWLGGYYLVGSPRPDNASFPLLTETVLYRPNYVKAGDIPALLSSHYEPFIKVNKETNTLSISGSSEIIARIRRDLAEVDQAPRQVMIEALVAEMSTDVSRQLGISWGGGAAKGSDSTSRFAFKLLPQSVKGADTSVFAVLDRIGIRSGRWVGEFQMRLSALVEEGKASIRANPRIATIEGNKARIFIGREQYFSILTGSLSFAYAQLEVIKTGIILTITPYVSEDGFITMEVEPEVSDVIGSGSTGLPVTNKRSVTTKVRVAEGETVVIGGLVMTNRIDVTRKVPLLGSIPILGALFRHNSTQLVESEVTVLITPSLWQPQNESERSP